MGQSWYVYGLDEKMCKLLDSSIGRAVEQYSGGPGFEPKSICTLSICGIYNIYI
jgi:hypothetical protein